MAAKLGWYNVDAMLASADPQQLEKWSAYYDLEPFSQEWDQASLIASEITNNFLRLMGGLGGAKSEEIPFLDQDYFVPGRYTKEQLAEKYKKYSGQIDVTDSKAALMFFKGLTRNGV